MKTLTEKPVKATTLQTQILCLNTLYAHCKEIIKNEIAFLLPLIGKKVLKVDGSFQAKYEHEKPQFKAKVSAFNFEFWTDTHYYFKENYGKLSINVVTTVHGGGYDKNGVNCNHSQQTQPFDLFTINDGVLTELVETDRTFLDTVYDENEILAEAKKTEDAAKVYEAQIEKVPYMFRDTLYLRRLR